MLAGELLPAPTAAHPMRAAQNADVEQLLAAMTPTQRVGQLFLVTFPGTDLSPESPAARLVRDLHVGGVALRPSNGNFGAGSSVTVTEVVSLTNGLQSLAAEGAAALGGAPFVPLFIAVELPGEQGTLDDGLPRGGFTEIPTPMALGATWSATNAETVGRLIGQELRAVGINMLLGPALDVLTTPRPELRGDLGAAAFGGDPYWVSRMGRAFVRGVHSGAEGQVSVVVQHFPGLGASDRRADEEIATIQKSLDELRLSELPPFFAVTALREGDEAGTTDGLMPANIRYRGLQGNIRQLTRPISLDAQNLPTIMGLPEFQPWRAQGGLLVSDALGVPALRRFYVDSVGTFPPKQVAQAAFVAGNDLLFLADFGQSDDWEEQFANIQSAIDFFTESYANAPDFAARVDDSVRRLLTLKLRLTGGDMSLAGVTRPADDALTEVLRRDQAEIARIAQEAATLLYPSPEEHAALLPSPPLPNESILIFTDAHPVAECRDCPPRPYIPPQAFERALLARYGPSASLQVSPDRLRSFTFDDLQRYLSGTLADEAAAGELESWLQQADWVVFLMGQVDASGTEAPTSGAIKLFLRQPREQLGMQRARLLVFAFGAPYYLDATEISKLTAYYGLYSPTPSFVEAAAKLLFQEFRPRSASPVSVPGLNYDLISRLEPDPGQVIQLELANLQPVSGTSPSAIDVSVGDQITLRTGTIRDRNGNPVPDGTPVTFILGYPAERIELPRMTTTTMKGVAEVAVVLDRVGQLEIKAVSEPAVQSTTLLLTIAGEGPGFVATEVPPPTPTATATATPSPTVTPRPPTRTPRPATPTVTPTPTPTGLLRGGSGRVGWWTLLLSIGSMVLAAGLTTAFQPPPTPPLMLRRFLLASAWGLGAYLLFVLALGLDLVPAGWDGSGAIWVVFVAALIPWFWERMRQPG